VTIDDFTLGSANDPEMLGTFAVLNSRDQSFGRVLSINGGAISGGSLPTTAARWSSPGGGALLNTRSEISP
jgi:hypothetical protein